MPANDYGLFDEGIILISVRQSTCAGLELGYI